MGQLSILLKDKDTQITSKINKTLIREVDRVMDRLTIRVIGPIRNLIRNTLLEQPEVQSVSGGTLSSEFGLPDGRNRIEEIIELWVSNIIVSKKKATASNNRISAGLTIKMIRSDYEDVISLPSASIITGKGTILPWLEWLLKFGDQIIVRDYDVVFGSYRGSRTGTAIMVGGKEKRWGVPPEYAGTLENNFVTRALDSIEDDIVRIFESRLKVLV